MSCSGTFQQWRSRFLFPLLAVFLIPVIVYGFFLFQTRKSDELILTGQYPAALKTLRYWKLLPLVNGRVYERIGTAELLFHGKASAEPFLRRAETKPFFSPVPFWQDVLKTLWTNARYEDGLLYTEHIQKEIDEQNILRFYRAGFLAGANQLGQAQKEIVAVGNIPELSKEIATLKSEIELRLTTRQYTFLYDRKNLPLVSKSFQGAFKILYGPVQPVLRNRSGDYLAKLNDLPNRQATLTLDYKIQAAALKALGKYAGAIVLLDVQKGDILAAATINTAHPPGTDGAFHRMYEPGSIIKMITLAGAYESQTNPEKLFPLKCEGSMKLSDNKILYCWKVHEQVRDVNVATAVSCNVSFGKIGLVMKPSDLLWNLRRFGFDSKLEDAFLPLELGRITRGEMKDQYVANLSIGLEHLKMTPLHAAMVAAAIANEGVSMTPRLLLHYRNMIGIPYSAPRAKAFRTFMSKETAKALTKAMEQVVLHPDGTGRRAAVSNLPIAMKTGTAGEGASGYDAILIGFAPVRKPKVAFAIVAEHSGKAEFEGARITKLFLESIQAYIQ